MSTTKLVSDLELSNDVDTNLVPDFHSITLLDVADELPNYLRVNQLSKYTTEIEEENKLFQGAGGDVYKSTNHNPQTKHKYKTIVIKRLILRKDENPAVYRINSIKEFLINLKAASQSDQVIQPIDLCVTQDVKICIVLPFRQHSDLLSLFTKVRKKGTIKISSSHKNLIFYRIIHTVLSLHKINIIHRDIKPENILIKDDGCLELTDFGYAIDLSDLEKDLAAQQARFPLQLPNYLNFSLGTKSFKPPELHEYDENGKLIGENPILVKNLKKLDVWSLGILYFQLSRMVKPWSDTSPKDRSFTKYATFYQKNNLYEVESLACSKFNHDPNLAVFNDFDDDDLKSLLLKMLNPDPNTRFDIKQVLRSNWCLGLNDEYEKLISSGKDEILLKIINSL